MARWLELNRSTVSRWTKPKDIGGTGGIVPAKHQADIIRHARAAGKRLFPTDFFEADVAA